MKSKYTNKNEVKLIAAIMAFAMVLVAGLVVIDDEGTDATAVSPATGVENLPAQEGVITLDAEKKYYVSSDSTVKFGAGSGSGSGSVEVYVLNDKTLTITTAGSYTATVYSVASGPVGETIDAKQIAEIYVTTSGASEYKFTAHADSEKGNGTNAAGSIEYKGIGEVTPTNCAMEVANGGSSKTWYSVGAIININGSSAAVGTPTSVILSGNIPGISVTISNGNGTTNTNEFKLNKAKLSSALTVTLGTDAEIKIKDGGSETTETLTEGKLEVTQGTVTAGEHLMLTPKTFSGVAPTELTTALNTVKLTAGLALNESKLSGNAYVFNKTLSQDVKLGENITISFREGSSYSGTISGLKGTTADIGGSIGIVVDKNVAQGYVEVLNGENNGKLTLKAQKTMITPGKGTITGTEELFDAETDLITGSRFAINSIDGAVAFDGSTKDVVAFVDGFELRGENLQASGWNVIIPLGETIGLFKEGSTYSTIVVGEGSMYIFGGIEGDVKTEGNISATAKTVFWADSNGSTVEPFIVNDHEGGIATVLKVSSAGAFYILSEAQAVGWKINNTIIDWNTSSLRTANTVIYTTTDGAELASDRSNLAGEINLDAFEGEIKVNNDNYTTIINVVAGTTFTVSNDSTLQGSPDGKLEMNLNDNSELVIKNSNIFMEVTKGNRASVKVSAPVSEYGSPSTPISVGYMREATIKGEITGAKITVYGNLTVIDKAKLSSKSTMDIKKGGNLEVDGEFDVIGGITFNTGSTGTVNGTMNIGTADGGTTVGVTGSDLTVSRDGKVKVVAPRDKNSSPNILEVTNSAAGVFKVEGTLDVRGTIEADMIHDMGTVIINGQSVDTSITIYDGITLTLGSVNGKVTVTDDDVMKHAVVGTSTLSDGNEIEFSNVTGITVSEAVSSKTYTENNQTKRLYVSDMTLEGTVGAVNGTGSITLVKTGNYVDKAYTGGKVEISGEVTLGEGVTFTLKKQTTDPTNLVISGTVTCIAKDAKMVFEKDTTTTVSGSVVVKTGTGFSLGLTGQQYLSATEFVIDDVANATKTTTYTTFENAVAEIAKAEDMTVTVYGSVSTAADNEIPKDATLVIEGTLTVSKDNTLTAKVGSNIEGTTITVFGTFTVEDYRNDLDVRTVSGDVVSVNGDAKTWTSLANALAIVAPGSVITADKPVELGSVTIPADVTVETEYDVTIKKNSVLTVDGTLTILKGTIESKGSSPDTPGKLVVGKTGAVAVVADDEPDVMKDVSGAHFEKLVGAKNYCYVSNVDFAVKTIDEKLQSEIRLIGEVDVGDVTFTKTDKMTSLVIAIEKTTSADLRTVVGGNITLVGAKLTIDDGVMFSGSVSAASDVADAEIGFEEASNVVIESYTDTTVSTPVSYMLFDGTSANGKVTIVSGTVTVGKIGTSMNGATVNTDKDLVLTVAEGATLQVPQNSTINVDKSEKGDKATFTVDGNLIVKKGTVDVKASAIMNINGTTVISDSANVKVNGTLNVFGTVTVSDEVGKEGVLTNYNVITVGSKPTTLGAAGTIDGKVKIMAGYVLIYDGEVGKIVSSSDTDAKSTLVTINGIEYVKIVGNGDVRDILADADIELTGINGFTSQTKIYSDEGMTQEITDADFAVGEFDAIYFELDASVVKGLVSVGTGIEVFIDGAKNAEGGIAVPLTVGTHTVDYNILTGYDGKNVVITFNGQTVQKGGQITITADMKDFSLIVTGATPAETVAPTPVQPTEADDGMDITDYLLIVLVVLAAILVVIVAIRMLRN